MNGWYPDGSGKLRYWDGHGWTQHAVPVGVPADARHIQVAGPNHGLHLALSLITCGLWLPVWVIVALNNHKQVTYVNEYGHVVPVGYVPQGGYQSPGAVPPRER